MALRGTSSRSFTFIHHLAPGIAPSREIAQTQREEAVIQPMPQIIPRTIMGTSSVKAPPEDPTALLIILGIGWAEVRSARYFRSGITKTIGIRKSRPATVLIQTVATIALGTWTAGCRTSSHILRVVSVMSVALETKGWRQGDTYEIIMPVDKVPYAACRSLTQNDQPSGQPELFSKCVKTHSGSRRPSLATTRMAMIIAITPAKVQTIAAV